MWTKTLSPAESLNIARTLALYEARLAGPAGRTLYDLLDRSAWRDVLSFDFDYSSVTVDEATHIRQALAFITKNEALVSLLDDDLESQAYAKFLQSETKCAETNALFAAHRRGQLCWTPAFEQILYLAKWKVEKMLGDAPSFADLDVRLGPGACTRIKRKNAIPAEKLMNLACSVDFVPYLSLFQAENDAWLREHAKQHGNYWGGDILAGDERYLVNYSEEFGRLTFVSKDAKSKRTIVIEPNVNQLHQLALGGKIAAALRRNGIDISNQVTNQCLARFGSLSGALATLDLSSASDSIAYELVRFLVPDAWWSFLNGFRSSSVTYRGRTIRLEKFSSMGNGFTFPLETLIFYALIWASCPRHQRSWLSAYGDDLVVPSDNAEACIATLEGVGFTINHSKSHISGPFRESCGADYFRGVNIRPFYLKKLVSMRVLFSAYNFFQEKMDTDMCDLIMNWIDPKLILWGPPGFGDGHLVSAEWPTKPHRRKDGWGGWLFYTYTLEATVSQDPLPGDYLEILYRLYSETYRSLDSDPYSSAGKVPTDLTWEAFPWDFVDPSIQRGVKGALKKTYPTTSRDERAYRRIAIYTLHR